MSRKIFLKNRNIKKLRSRVTGTFVRPRLSLKFSNKHIYAQCINDITKTSLFCMTTNIIKLKTFKFNLSRNLSKSFGKYFAKELIKRNIFRLRFDRSGRKFHGKIKTFLNELRTYILV